MVYLNCFHFLTLLHGQPIRKVQGNHKGLKLNGAHQLLGFADCQFTGKKTYYKAKHNTSLVASKDTGLETNSYKSMDMSSGPAGVLVPRGSSHNGCP